jgi:hypothetical protein
MDAANPMVSGGVVQANVEVRIQAVAAPASYIIVRMAVSAALAKRPRRQCAGWYVGYRREHQMIFSSSPNYEG